MKVNVRVKHELRDFDVETRKYKNVTCSCGRTTFKKFLSELDERGIVEESSLCDCGAIYHWAYGNVVGEVKDGIDWLLKRAEDARRNEGNLSAVKRRLRESEEQNKRYREALEFYAKKSRYIQMIKGSNILLEKSRIDKDEGITARKALEDTQ